MKLNSYKKYKIKNIDYNNLSIKRYILPHHKKIYEKYDINFFDYVDETIENYAIYKAFYGGNFKIKEIFLFLNNNSYLINEGIKDKIKNFFKSAWGKVKNVLNKIKGWVLMLFTYIKNFKKTVKTEYVKIVQKSDLEEKIFSDKIYDTIYNNLKKNKENIPNVDSISDKKEVVKTYFLSESSEFVDACDVIVKEAKKVKSNINNITKGIESIWDIKDKDLKRVPDDFVKESKFIKNFIHILNEGLYDYIIENDKNNKNKDNENVDDDIDDSTSEKVVIDKIRKICSKVSKVIIKPIQKYIEKYKNIVNEIASVTNVSLKENKNTKSFKKYKLFENESINKLKPDEYFTYKSFVVVIFNYLKNNVNKFDKVAERIFYQKYNYMVEKKTPIEMFLVGAPILTMPFLVLLATAGLDALIEYVMTLATSSQTIFSIIVITSILIWSRYENKKEERKQSKSNINFNEEIINKKNEVLKKIDKVEKNI